MGINYSPNDFNIPHKSRNFRTLDYGFYGRGYKAYTPNLGIIGHSMKMASGDVPGLATFDCVSKVFHHNPDTITAFSRGYREDAGAAPIGILAHLPLNHEGAQALFTGELDTGAPDLKYICAPHERPAALYFWFIYLPEAQGGGMALVMERMTSHKNRGLPIFCKAANEKAEAFFEKMGFMKGAQYGHHYSRALMSCPPANLAAGRKPYDNYIPGQLAGTKKTSVTVVHSLDDILKCIAIRGAAYLEDRSIPYAEDVDGNDFTATHLLGYVGDEPAGCLRLRYFAGFIKIERLAVITRFRGSLALDLVRAALQFGKDKGYRRFYGQAAFPATKIWEHFGFKRRNADGLTFLTDEVYHEMDLETDEQSASLSRFSPPMVLVRPEGQWDRPGPLEIKPEVEVPNKALGSGEWVPGVSPPTFTPDRDSPGVVNPFYGESPTCGKDSWPPLIYGHVKGLNDG